MGLRRFHNRSDFCFNRALLGRRWRREMELGRRDAHFRSAVLLLLPQERAGLAAKANQRKDTSWMPGEVIDWQGCAPLSESPTLMWWKSGSGWGPGMVT